MCVFVACYNCPQFKGVYFSLCPWSLSLSLLLSTVHVLYLLQSSLAMFYILSNLLFLFTAAARAMCI